MVEWRNLYTDVQIEEKNIDVPTIFINIFFSYMFKYEKKILGMGIATKKYTVINRVVLRITIFWVHRKV